MAVCHVLRYFPPVLKIREIIDKGLIGEVVTIDHRHSI
jgi:predicted dehydrogenase